MQNIQEFIDLGLSEKSIEAIKAKGFETPTEIQKRCIPVLLSGHGDLIGSHFATAAARFTTFI